MPDPKELERIRERTFPIQKGTDVPWAMAQRAYVYYSEQYGNTQSIERMAQRGGFGWQEFACFLAGHDPRSGHVECTEKAMDLCWPTDLARLRSEVEGLREALDECERLKGLAEYTPCVDCNDTGECEVVGVPFSTTVDGDIRTIAGSCHCPKGAEREQELTAKENARLTAEVERLKKMIQHGIGPEDLDYNFERDCL